MNEAVTRGKLVRPKLFELAAAELREHIISGNLPEGAALPPELELIAQFGISRPTLRQAFRVLESESLITINRGVNGGVHVGRPDVRILARYASYLLAFSGAALEDVYLVRLAVVPTAARMVARERRPEDISALRQLLEEATAVRDDPDAYLGAMTRFTGEIIARSGNTTFALIGAITNEMYSGTVALLSSRVDPADNADMLARVARDAQQLFKLIQAGKGVEAERLWRSYMRAIHEFVHDHLGGHKVVEALEFVPVGATQNRAGRAKLATVVAEGLRQRILADELRVGDPLPSTNELTQEFGVSGPTLREGLRILESESLITIHRGVRGGARVSRPDIGVLARYASYALAFGGATTGGFVVGGAVSPVAARRLSQHRTAADIAALRSRVDEARLAVRDREAFGARLLALLKEVVDRAGSPMLSLLNDMSLATWKSVVPRLGDYMPPDSRVRNCKRMLDTWLALIDMIEERKPAKAETLAQTLLDDMAATVLKHVWDAPLLDLMRHRPDELVG
jgi:DNA-binding FadR family transcriptional regulator